MKVTTVRVCTIVYCLSPLSLMCVCVRGEPHVFLRGEPRRAASARGSFHVAAACCLPVAPSPLPPSPSLSEQESMTVFGRLTD